MLFRSDVDVDRMELLERCLIISPTEIEVHADFDDVQDDEWYYNTVDYIFKSGLMTGLDNRNFGPNESLARAQFAVIMHRKEGSPDAAYAPTFKDVASGQWYTKPILWANEAGVVKGYTNGCFGPGDAINREQMAVIMYRYAGINGYNTTKRADISVYADSNKVSDYSKQAVQWCVAEGIITGKNQGTILDPQGNATRAECAAIIKRFVEKYN